MRKPNIHIRNVCTSSCDQTTFIHTQHEGTSTDSHHSTTWWTNGDSGECFFTTYHMWPANQTSLHNSVFGMNAIIRILGKKQK